MRPAEAVHSRRVLFVQATEPAGYPPLIHASMLMAEAGWEVTILSAPFAGNDLELPPHPRIAVRALPERPSHVMHAAAFARYNAAAAWLALRLRPDVVYASDPLGAGPGLLAARLARARLVYHEHDNPAPGTLRPFLARQRAAAAQRAVAVIFPNAARATIAQTELGFAPERLHIVWNQPKRAELPVMCARAAKSLMLYYHGGISPERCPETVVEGLRRLNGRARLRIVGRETPGAPGHIARLIDASRGIAGCPLVTHVGQISRADLLDTAAGAHVGLAVMPLVSDDVNMRHMAGASNKAFDYMAAGLPLLVSELPEWREMFVVPGYGRACDPTDPASIAAAITWFLDHPVERQAISARNRAKIETEWNFDRAFASVLAVLGSD